MNITLFFKPQPDITAYELALCLPFIPQYRKPIPAALPGMGYVLPKEVFRHFDCVYDPNDEESARWVREVFLPNNVVHKGV